jgi:hypothetical protein
MDIKNIDDLMAYTTPTGSFNKSLGNKHFGFNHRGTPSFERGVREYNGLVFFTKPRLNLTKKNIEVDRNMLQLGVKNQNDVANYIRATLDPVLPLFGDQTNGNMIYKPEYLDPLQAFIPVLSNNIKSLSGFPDFTMDSYTSAEGSYKDQRSFADGHVKQYSTFNLDAVFNNTKEETIMKLFDYWLRYISLVVDGTMLPYSDAIIENETDYDTRIYRFIFSEDNTKIKKAAMVGAAYPISLPIGGHFEYNTESHLNDENLAETTIRFSADGVYYNDPIIFRSFNETVTTFNKFMLNKEENMVKLSSEQIWRANYRGYPYVNLDTFELEWWADKQVYERIKDVPNILL